MGTEDDITVQNYLQVMPIEDLRELCQELLEERDEFELRLMMYRQVVRELAMESML